jgi:dCTP deaminase
MELVDWQIEEYVNNGIIGIKPFDIDNINPNSYDITLGNKFKVYTNPNDHIIDPYDEFSLKKLDCKYVECNEIVVYPHEALLASTIEIISLPINIKAELDGKSSIARLFINNHQCGGYIDAGFHGEITLEIDVKFPTRLYTGMKIGQLKFTKTEDCKLPYNKRISSKYNGQTGPTESMYYKNQKKINLKLI